MKTKNNIDYEMIKVEGGSFAIGNIMDKEVKGDSKKSKLDRVNR